MFKKRFIGNVYVGDAGVTLVELLIVFVILGVMLTLGVAGYRGYAAKNSVRRAANELLQNMRLASTLAIKENRDYKVIFDYNNQVYRVGYDGNNDGDLLDNQDGFSNGSVKTVDIQNIYGSSIVMGSGNFTTTPPNGPNGSTITDAPSFSFNPDGSAGGNGSVYFQQTRRGYTYCVRLANAAGKIDLYVWDGDKDNKTLTGWTEVR